MQAQAAEFSGYAATRPSRKRRTPFLSSGYALTQASITEQSAKATPSPGGKQNRDYTGRHGSSFCTLGGPVQECAIRQASKGGRAQLPLQTSSVLGRALGLERKSPVFGLGGMPGRPRSRHRLTLYASPSTRLMEASCGRKLSATSSFKWTGRSPHTR
jgi:hypothetical protein